MDLHAIQGDRRDHVLTTHRGEADETPLQLVSATQVAYWQRIETLFAELLETLAKAELHQLITQAKK